MSVTRVRKMPRLPLAKGPEAVAWVIDFTPVSWVEKVWWGDSCPYNYTPAGQMVRLSMPTRGVIRYSRLLDKLADRVMRHRLSESLPEQFYGGDEWSDMDRAELIVATALIEKDTTFATVRVEPSGRVWFCHRLKHTASWHPGAPRPEGDS